jgi:hypothetical protein
MSRSVSGAAAGLWARLDAVKQLWVGAIAIAMAGSAHARERGTIQGHAPADSQIEVRDPTNLFAVFEIYADNNGWFSIDVRPNVEYVVRFRDGVVREVIVTAGAVIDLDDFDPLTWRADHDYAANIPARPRTYDTLLYGAPTMHNDGYGAAFASATSLDNRYFVEGIDTTEVLYGQGGTLLPIELVDSVSVRNEGTGSQISVNLPSGTNQVHGSVFGSWSPSVTDAAVPHNPTTIDVSPATQSSEEVGFTLSGPIAKDKLWFFVGFAPQFSRADYTRTINSRTDCHKTLPDGMQSQCSPDYADGVADVDPKTGYYLVDPLASELRSATTQTYSAVAKIDYVRAESEGALTAIIVPSIASTPELVGDAASGSRVSQLTTDLGARWKTHFDVDLGKLTLDASAGWHRQSIESGAIDPSLDDKPRVYLDGEQLSDVTTAPTTCTSRYPGIDACPFTTNYPTGGPGYLQHDLEDRKSVHLGATLRTATNELAASLATDVDTTRTAHVYSGGELDFKFPGDETREYIVNFAPLDDPDPRFNQTCITGTAGYKCQYVSGDVNADGSSVDVEAVTSTLDVHDTWRPDARLAVTAEAVVQRQALRYPQDLQNRLDPQTDQVVGTNALYFNDVSPRLGIVYDPTSEGRAQLFAHAGRYYDRLPTQIIEQGFSRTGQVEETELGGVGTGAVLNGPFFGPVVDPAIKPASEDVLVAGAALLPIDHTTLAATWQHRRIHNAIEDVYDIATGDYALTNPPARRDYDALELSATTRYKRLFVQASYVYSRTFGNYPGTIDYDNSDQFGHQTSRFDHPNANEDGVLPQDQPHQLIVSAYDTISLTHDLLLTLGARYRAMSGTRKVAIDQMEGNILIDPDALGRTDFEQHLDVHVAVSHSWKTILGQLYLDVYNATGAQAAASVDSVYTSVEASYITPISKGSYSDLIWLRSDLSNTNVPAPKNPNFGHPTSYEPPRTFTLGARVSF